jgi:hypothetical protein
MSGSDGASDDAGMNEKRKARPSVPAAPTSLHARPERR